MKQRSFLLYFFFYIAFLNAPILCAGNRTDNLSSKANQTKNLTSREEKNKSISHIITNLKELINQQQNLVEHIDYAEPEYQVLIDENIRDIFYIIDILKNKDDLQDEQLEEIQSIQHATETMLSYLKEQSPEDFKAPRPSASSATANDAVVGKNACDLTQVLALLSNIKKRIEILQRIICEKFAFTWTILEDLKVTITEDIFDTQTILCDKFNGVFTTLQEIEVDISGIFTVLEDLDISVTIGELTVSLSIDLSGVFTVLEDICEKIVGTFTVLQEIEDDIFDTQTILCDKFNGTFTTLQEIEIDISGIFTVLEDLEITITEDIFDTQTILCDKFNGTFTTLQEIEIDISGIFTVLENLTVTAFVDLSGVFTVLQDICEKVEGTFTVLEELETTITEDIFDTRTILCDKFNGTFTTLQEIEIDISGIFTVLEDLEITITEDIFDTQTILCDKFNGTFTTLQEIEIDISGIFTVLENLTVTAFVDLSGVFTVLQDICEKVEGTFTVLEELETTITEDIFDTRTILCDKFNGTFTTLQEIEIDISGIFTVLEDFTVTVSVDLSEIFTVLEEIQNDIFDTRTILCDKFNGTFTMLQFICEKIEDDDDRILAALCTPTVIQQMDIGSTTFTISTSGFYVFGENLIFNPAAGQPAIEIITNDVTIDMCGKALQQGNSTANVDGFRIVGDAAASPRSNVTIINGIVSNFTRAGITVGTNITTPANTACELITLRNLNIVDCEIRGIEFLGSSGASIEKSIINNCGIFSCCTDASADDVLRFEFVECSKIDNCQINENGASGIDLIGMHLRTSTQIIVSTVDVLCNLAQTFSGISMDGSIDVLLDDCSVKNNMGTNALTGIVIFGGSDIQGNTIFNCAVSNNQSTNGPFAGYELLAFVTRNNIEQSIASNNLVTGAVASAHCFGFNLDQPTFCCINRCIASNNRSTGNGTTNVCVGFNIGTSGSGTTGTKNCDFIGNRAIKNNGFNDARSFGFRPLSAAGGNTNNAYSFNVAIRNGPTTPISTNQVVANGGGGSNSGGVPTGSVRSRTVSNLNSQRDEYSNIRII